MAGKILVVLEQRAGLIKKSSFEAISKAVGLSVQSGMPIAAVVCGNEVHNISEVARFGVKEVIHLKNRCFELYSSTGYRDAILDTISKHDVKIMILANSAFGRDLAPRLAARLNASLLMDCIELEIVEGILTGSRPIFGGKAYQKVRAAETIQVATLRPNIFKLEPNPVELELTEIDVSTPNLSCRVVEVEKSEGKIDVAEAEIIISGGRGMKAAENFQMIEQLAEVLGGAVGASRAVVDAGWRPHSEQVGQTGKTVSPTLYIACGISGAIQHLAGMSSSKYIVAINKDKDAPIFSVADYGITGDVFDIIPALIEEIKKLKA